MALKVLLAGKLSTEQWDEYAHELSVALRQQGLTDAFELFTEAQVELLSNPAQVYAQIDVCVVANPTDVLWPKLSQVKWVQSLWAGVDKLLASPTLPLNVQISRMVDPFMTATMAEAVCTHALWLHRQMHRYAGQQRAGQWVQLKQRSAAQCQIGIVGYGELGQACAQALRALGFTVYGYRRTKPEAGVYTDEFGLQALLNQSDIVVNLLPLSSQTHEFFNAQRFAQFKSNASFINVARGDHVVESALQGALAQQLDHAILDVFSVEPLPTDHWLWRHPKVTLTPHVAADSRPETVVKVVADNMKRYINGETLQFVVDRQLGY